MTTLAPATLHWLATGCFSGNGIELDVFLVAGRVLHGHFDGLRRLWRAHRDAVKAQHPAETFAEIVMKPQDGDWCGVPLIECREHAMRSKEE